MPALALHRLLIVGFVALLQTAVPAPLAAQPASRPASVSPADARGRLQAFARYLEGRGITRVEDTGAWWRVERPAGDGSVVVVRFRVYPAATTEEQMREDLVQVNLAFRLTPPHDSRCRTPE